MRVPYRHYVAMHLVGDTLNCSNLIIAHGSGASVVGTVDGLPEILFQTTDPPINCNVRRAKPQRTHEWTQTLKIATQTKLDSLLLLSVNGTDRPAENTPQ